MYHFLLRTALLATVFASSLGGLTPSAVAQHSKATRQPRQASGLDIRLTTNKLPGLLAFLESIAGQPHSARRLRALFEQSGAADTLASEALERFKGFDLHAHCYTYRNLPHGQSICPWDFYRMAAVKATGWSDFRDRTVGLYSNAVQATILQAMRDLEPIYDILIWEPYHARFRRRVAALEAYLERHEVGTLLQKMAQFYGSTWPAALPLWVGFYPLPGEKGFSANVSGNVVVSGMPVRLDDHVDYVSIIFHELGHQLFAQQPAALAHRIRETMRTSASSHRLFAYRWLNEALATAVGNGWVYRQLAGHLYEEGWYTNRYIDGYARALYPRVSAYLGRGQRLDDDLLRYAVAQFEATFPEALTDPANVLAFFSLVTDAPRSKMGDFKDVFYEVFRSWWVTTHEGFTEEVLRKALTAPASTVVLLTGASPKAQRLIREHLPALSQLPPEPYAYMLIDGSHPVLLLRAETPEQLQTILEKIRREGLTLRRHLETR